MNNTKPYFDANKAWVKLSGRLQDEGLLPKKHDASFARRYLPYIKIAATFAVVVATAAMVYFFSTPKGSETIFVANKVQGQTLVKTLADGSIVYLAGNSSIVFDESYNNSNRLLKLYGEAFFEVVSNANLPFVVEMNNAKVEVIGTTFNLKNFEGQDIELTVETGKVGFLPNQNPQRSILVEVGQKLVFDGKDFTKNTFISNTDWREKHLHFNNEKLLDILSVINKNFEVNITLEAPLVAEKQLTVTFFNNTPSEMISIFCEYYNLNAKFVDETNIVLSKR